MTTRAFDPVFSEAFRDELVRLAETEAPPQRPQLAAAGPSRVLSGWLRQAAIVGVTLVIVIGASILAIRAGTDLRAPAATHSPAPTPTLTPTPVPTTLPSSLTPPTVAGTVVGTASGTGEVVTGRMRAPVTSLLVTTTCQGTGILTIHTSDGFTLNINPAKGSNECSLRTPRTTHVGLSTEGGMQSYGRLKYTITPHGHMVWAVTFSESK